MKRPMIILLAILLFSTSTGPSAYSNGIEGEEGNYPKILVKIKGVCEEKACGTGYNIQGTSYVPIRLVSESLGAQVQWDPSTNTVMVIKDQNASEEKDDLIEFYKETELIYFSITNELSQLFLVHEHLDLADLMFQKTNEVQWIHHLTGAKLAERKLSIQQLTEKVIAYQENYGRNNSKMNEIISIVSEMNNIAANIEVAAKKLENYTMSKSVDDYKNYLVFRKISLELYEKSTSKMAEIEKEYIQIKNNSETSWVLRPSTI